MILWKFTYINMKYVVLLYKVSKKETGTNMDVFLKLDKHFNMFGYFLLKGYSFQRYQEM